MNRKTRWLRHAIVSGVLMVLALATVAALSATRMSGQRLNGTEIKSLPNVQDVTLTATGGATVRLSEWRGDVVLVFFGYANCPDVCPLTMARLAQIYRKLGEPKELQVVMVTVDPERDRPELLERYVQRFHPDFVGLTGTQSMIATASSRFYVGSIGADANPDGRVSHSSHVTLVDPRGRMRLIYNQDKIGDALRQDLTRLLAEGNGW